MSSVAPLLTIKEAAALTRRSRYHIEKWRRVVPGLGVEIAGTPFVRASVLAELTTGNVSVVP